MTTAKGQTARGLRPYGLAGTIGADDERQGLEERDDVLVLRVEAPDPLDEHLVHGTHPPLPLQNSRRRRARERESGKEGG